MAYPSLAFADSFVHKPTRRTRAFSLIELIVTIAIIAILGSIVTVVTQRALNAGKITQSQSNLRQVHATLNLYANDNKGVYPLVYNFDTKQSWIAAVWSYAYENRHFPGTTPGNLEGSIFYTPFVENETTARTFGLNDILEKRLPARRYRNLATPAAISFVGDTKTSGGLNVNQVNYRNQGRVHVLFLDGHVASLTPSDVPTTTTTASLFWTGGLTTAE